MTAAVFWFGEVTQTMTFAEGLAFVERTRRQLNRLGDPSSRQGMLIGPQEIGEIRRVCDELETDIKTSLGIA